MNKKIICKHKFEPLSVVSIGVGEQQYGADLQRCVKCGALREEIEPGVYLTHIDEMA